jgi:hypothetical protein
VQPVRRLLALAAGDRGDPGDYDDAGEKAPWLHGPVVGLNLYRWPAVDFVLELPLIV